ncbi:MAG: hypothetical protein FWG47_01635 [Propionibacteriaceae bacterium]|nr:hypothetical protein [Propionibacteriaceae bacterium]
MSLSVEQRKTLEAERADLVSRLGEIDALLRSATSDVIPDDTSWVLLSSTGLLGRWESAEISLTGPRTTHDVITSAIRTPGIFGVITNQGRIIQAKSSELPQVASGLTTPNLQGGILAGNFIALAAGEKALALTTLTSQTYGWALGTRNGIVKRTNPEIPKGDEPFEIIRLEAGDEVVGACELQHEHRQLVFITDDGKLLHYPAASVRPQGRAGGGIVGIKLELRTQVVFFGAGNLASDLVATNAGRTTAIASESAGSLKVTPLDAFPTKGRATGGVRCHRFLKGEDTLYSGWVGAAPAIAATKTGSPSNLPQIDPRRDGSGTPASLRVSGIGSRKLEL